MRGASTDLDSPPFNSRGCGVQATCLDTSLDSSECEWRRVSSGDRFLYCPVCIAFPRPGSACSVLPKAAAPPPPSRLSSRSAGSVQGSSMQAVCTSDRFGTAIEKAGGAGAGRHQRGEWGRGGGATTPWASGLEQRYCAWVRWAESDSGPATASFSVRSGDKSCSPLDVALMITVNGMRATCTSPHFDDATGAVAGCASNDGSTYNECLWSVAVPRPGGEDWPADDCSVDRSYLRPEDKNKSPKVAAGDTAPTGSPPPTGSPTVTGGPTATGGPTPAGNTTTAGGTTGGATGGRRSRRPPPSPPSSSVPGAPPGDTVSPPPPRSRRGRPPPGEPVAGPAVPASPPPPRRSRTRSPPPDVASPPPAEAPAGGVRAALNRIPFPFSPCTQRKLGLSPFRLAYNTSSPMKPLTDGRERNKHCFTVRVEDCVGTESTCCKMGIKSVDVLVNEACRDSVRSALLGGQSVTWAFSQTPYAGSTYTTLSLPKLNLARSEATQGLEVCVVLTEPCAGLQDFCYGASASHPACRVALPTGDVSLLPGGDEDGVAAAPPLGQV
ncbi:hypothetical protein HYH03_016886 [Edaphochlamys debaryana]|uniref:Pherophorin domain-containing protein n=1 Tax=Edaphochlamys debaryana TaxID=47281 RepID=A0A836BR23_9CHLO|nr:hypothetical protein HYH03_016886 [Edaphochlamys debaryana]|eukprot:KAG2484344.1 hypothetical protein HYH03_016886 [Edaphochlamys debaryana]